MQLNVQTELKLLSFYCCKANNNFFVGGGGGGGSGGSYFERPSLYYNLVRLLYDNCCLFLENWQSFR